MNHTPGSERRFVGTTEECFSHFINQFSGLEAASLLAEYCFPAPSDNTFAKLEKVLAWQMGKYFPGGDALLRLRCFLHISSKYDVVEFKRLNGDAQTLALTIACDLIDPHDVERRLGYTMSEQPQPRGLWRILIQGQRGYTKLVNDNIRSLNEELEDRRNIELTHWLQFIEDLYGELSPTEMQETTSTPSVAPELATAFARQIAATTALGSALRSNPEAVRTVIAATRGGSDIQELIGVLETFS